MATIATVMRLMKRSELYANPCARTVPLSVDLVEPCNASHDGYIAKSDAILSRARRVRCTRRCCAGSSACAWQETSSDGCGTVLAQAVFARLRSCVASLGSFVQAPSSNRTWDEVSATIEYAELTTHV